MKGASRIAARCANVLAVAVLGVFAYLAFESSELNRLKVLDYGILSFLFIWLVGIIARLIGYKNL